MARYNGLIIPRSYNDYFSRSDPQAIRNIVALSADGELNAESKNLLQNQAIAKIVPVTASPDNKLVIQSEISGLTADVETIKNKIPINVYTTSGGGFNNKFGPNVVHEIFIIDISDVNKWIKLIYSTDGVQYKIAKVINNILELGNSNTFGTIIIQGGSGNYKAFDILYQL